MKFRIPILLLAVCVATDLGCRQDPVGAGRKFAKLGDDYVAQKKAPEAIIEYRKSIAANPRDGETRLKLARLYTDANDVPHALQSTSGGRSLGQQRGRTADRRSGLLSVGSFRCTGGLTRIKLQPKNPMLDPQSAPVSKIDGASCLLNKPSVMNRPPARHFEFGSATVAKGDPAAAELTLRGYHHTINQFRRDLRLLLPPRTKETKPEALKATSPSRPNLLANRTALRDR